MTAVKLLEDDTSAGVGMHGSDFIYIPHPTFFSSQKHYVFFGLIIVLGHGVSLAKLATSKLFSTRGFRKFETVGPLGV